MPVTVVVSNEELGIVLIALNSINPVDHREEFQHLKKRLTEKYKTRAPDRYRELVTSGLISS